METGASVKIYKTPNGAWSMEVLSDYVNWELVANLINDFEELIEQERIEHRNRYYFV